jgi:hypothetical protein
VDYDNVKAGNMAIVITKVADADVEKRVGDKPSIFAKLLHKLSYDSPVVSFKRENSENEKSYYFHTEPYFKAQYREYKIFPGKYYLAFRKKVIPSPNDTIYKNHSFEVKSGDIVYIGDLAVSYDDETLNISDNFADAKIYISQNPLSEKLIENLQKRLVQ